MVHICLYVHRSQQAYDETDSSSVKVSQFTLLATTKKGNKPDFHKSANAIKGKELYDHFTSHVRSIYREDRVKDGVFQAMMDVGLINDGPVGVDYTCIDEAVSPRGSAWRPCILRKSCFAMVTV